MSAVVLASDLLDLSMEFLRLMFKLPARSRERQVARYSAQLLKLIAQQVAERNYDPAVATAYLDAGSILLKQLTKGPTS